MGIKGALFGYAISRRARRTGKQKKAASKLAQQEETKFMNENLGRLDAEVGERKEFLERRGIKVEEESRAKKITDFLFKSEEEKAAELMEEREKLERQVKDYDFLIKEVAPEVAYREATGKYPRSYIEKIENTIKDEGVRKRFHEVREKIRQRLNLEQYEGLSTNIANKIADGGMNSLTQREKDVLRGLEQHGWGSFIQRKCAEFLKKKYAS